MSAVLERDRVVPISLTIPAAAEATGVTEKAIKAAIHSGALKAKRQSVTAKGEPTGKYLIGVPALQAWFDGLPDA